MAGITAVLNALKVLEGVAARQPIGVTQLSQLTDMPKTSVQRSVVTLREAGWLKSVGEGKATRWELAPKAEAFGAGRAGSQRERTYAAMVQLRDVTGETVHLVVPDFPEVVIIERVDSLQAVRTFVQLGSRAPMHATSTGRAILAASKDSLVEEIIAAGLRRYTPQTVVDPDRLRAEIERIREDGYAVNDTGWRPGVAAIGAAVVGLDGAPTGAITVSMPADRYTPELAVRIGPLVAGVAASLSTG